MFHLNNVSVWVGFATLQAREVFGEALEHEIWLSIRQSKLCEVLTVKTFRFKILVYSNDVMGAKVHYLVNGVGIATEARVYCIFAFYFYYYWL